jgi:hypothetical protein
MNDKYVLALQKLLGRAQHLYSIDPGGNTGIICVHEGKILMHKTLGVEKMYDWCATKPFVPNSTIVLEEFLLYPWVASKLSFDTIPSARVIGAVETASRVCHGSTVYQNAAQAKEAVPNTLVHAVFPGVDSTFTKHEIDAIRHAILYTSKTLSKVDTRPR